MEGVHRCANRLGHAGKALDDHHVAGALNRNGIVGKKGKKAGGHVAAAVLGGGVTVFSAACLGFYQPQLLDVAGNGGLRYLEALLAQKAKKLLLRIHRVASDEFQDFFMAPLFIYLLLSANFWFTTS